MAVFTALTSRGLSSEATFHFNSKLRGVMLDGITPGTSLRASVHSREQAVDWILTHLPRALSAQPFRTGEWYWVGPLRPQPSTTDST